MATPQNSDWNNFWQRTQSQRFGKISWSKQRILNVLSPHAVRGKRALDAGSGSGFFSAYFCDQGMDTVSLDFSQAALDMTAKTTQGRSQGVRADLLNDALQERFEKKFDLIFSDGLLEHFAPESQDKILQNLSAVLAANGVIVTFVPNRWSPWELIRPLYMPGIDEKPFTFSQLKKLHQRNGLKLAAAGGVNVFPFRISPEFLGPQFGMLLYVIAQK